METTIMGYINELDFPHKEQFFLTRPEVPKHASSWVLTTSVPRGSKICHFQNKTQLTWLKGQ